MSLNDRSSFLYRFYFNPEVTISILIKFTKSRIFPRGVLSLYVVVTKLAQAVKPVY